MIQFFKYMVCFLVLSLWLSMPAVSKDSAGSSDTVMCTLTAIDGPNLITDCNKVFRLSEEMEIKDIAGRSISLYQLPLPSSVEIKYLCISDKDCSVVRGILLLQKLKVMPE